MKTEQFMLGNTPEMLYGEPADTLWLFIHGQWRLQRGSPAVCRNREPGCTGFAYRPAGARHTP